MHLFCLNLGCDDAESRCAVPAHAWKGLAVGRLQLPLSSQAVPRTSQGPFALGPRFESYQNVRQAVVCSRDAGRSVEIARASSPSFLQYAGSLAPGEGSQQHGNADVTLAQHG